MAASILTLASSIVAGGRYIAASFANMDSLTFNHHPCSRYRPKNSNSTEKLPETMYFTSAVLVLAGLSSVASAVAIVSYDDGMYHPDQPTTTAQVTTKATTYVSVISGTSKTSEYSEPSSWYPTLSKSTYVGYWSQNATVTSSYKTTSTTTSYAMPSGVNNVTMTMKPGNFSTTLTMTDRM